LLAAGLRYPVEVGPSVVAWDGSTSDDERVLVVGDTDGVLKWWDLRSLDSPLFELQVMDVPVRRIAWRPAAVQSERYPIGDRSLNP
jgi:hypothetical protein